MATDEFRLSRRAPTTSGTITLNRGEKVRFAADASSPTNVRGMEWYHLGHYIGPTYATDDGKQATFWRALHFPLPGNFRIAGVAFDTADQYSNPVSWTVDVAERPRLLYEDDLPTLLEERGDYWDFIADWRVDHLALYKLRGLLPGRSAELRDFIIEAREHNIAKIFAVVGAEDMVGMVGDYLDTLCAPCGGRFDGLLTEDEFWNDDTPERWDAYLRLLDEMRDLADEEQAKGGELVVATYLGRPSPQQARELRERVDLVLLHAYVEDPDEAYDRMSERLQVLASSEPGQPVQVWPIFSAECTGPEGATFMGKWFAGPRYDPLETAETTVLEAYGGAEGGPMSGLRLAGFAYFRRTLLATALANPRACG